MPNILFRKQLRSELSKLGEYERDYIEKRVNYYNKLSNNFHYDANMTKIKDFKLRVKLKPHVYFLDIYEYIRYFPKNNHFSFIFGDVTDIPKIPSMVKSRPIYGDNQNSVLLNLDKVRHFMFVKDKKRFEEKKDKLIGRLAVYQPHRVKFWEMYFGHFMCDLGQVNKSASHSEWVAKHMTIRAHLDFKFILCLEGNDVATNLKWVMSSNSIAVMPKPSYETWFMEGTLVGDYHYIEIKKDYSDLEEKLNYYIKHTDEALKIIENAHAFVRQFWDKKREKLISLLVLQKYFDYLKY
ncbi:MAG: lipopolysaccharide core biosynthesis protein LpsA [Campylobacteraceae bacterium]|nr:lipopolysaccharide core biosynthesis protein LpsA [Campylobacteraceae bacterium]